MGERLVQIFNEYSEAKNVLTCTEQPFETSKIDWPEVPPRTDVPQDLQKTIIGQQIMRGSPAMIGTISKYWIKCAPPENDPTAFDRSHEIIDGMPPEFNNMGWTLTRDGENDCYMAGVAFV